MNELKVFENPEFGRVRTVSVDNEPWFFAKDVCDALSIATNHVRESLDEDEVSNLRSTEIGPEFGGKAPLIVSEAGLYSLILKSRKPEAKAFKRWITHEVIPAIRKTGGYSIPQLTPNPHYRTRMIGTAVRDVGKTAEALEKVFGCRHGMALATASSMVGEAYGIDMTPVQRLIPAEDNPGTLSPSQIAESLGLFNKQGNPDAQTVNRMLQSCGLQDKPRDTSGANLKNAKWFLTEEGKFYGEQKPMDNKRTGYKGYQICWNADVLELLRKALN